MHFHLSSVLHSVSLLLKTNSLISQEISQWQLPNLIILRVLVTKGELVLLPVLIKNYARKGFAWPS